MMIFTSVYHVTATKINIGIDTAVPATILCINRRLYLLASQISVIPSKTEENRELIIDLVIGTGLPMIVIALCRSYNFSIYFFSLSIFSVYLAKLSIYNC